MRLPSLKIAIFFGFTFFFISTVLPAKAETTSSSEEYFPSALDAAVTPSSAAAVGVSTTTTVSSSTADVPQFGTEPFIRVGIAKTADRVLFFSEFPYTVMSGGIALGVIPGNNSATLTYVSSTYRLESAAFTVTSSDYIRLVPEDVQNYFTLLNLDRHLVKRSQMNFNAYRGIFEYRFAPKSGVPYLINEILLDHYVAGIAETSNSAPPEYIKALQIAARTYAYMNISKLPPTTDRMFDVYGSTNDQLYLGFNFEAFSPKIAFYTGGTRGLMVTYDSHPVTTYYFTRSNGWTKNMYVKHTKTIIPWLKAVKAKYDKGYKMLGHGYGMSNHDAVLRAQKDGWTYEKILTYYYTGTKIMKLY